MEESRERAERRNRREDGRQGGRRDEDAAARPYRPRTLRSLESSGETRNEDEAERPARREPRREPRTTEARGSYRPRTIRDDITLPQDREPADTPRGATSQSDATREEHLENAGNQAPQRRFDRDESNRAGSWSRDEDRPERRFGRDKRNRKDSWSRDDDRPGRRFDREGRDGARRAQSGSWEQRGDESRPRRRDAECEWGRGDSRYDARERRNSKEGLRSRDRQSKATASTFDPTQEMRLNRYIAHSGLCSRREADMLIEQGEVMVNGETVTTLGTRIIPAEVTVTCRGQELTPEKKVYILLNKPKDCFSTTDDPHAGRTVLDIVEGACQERIYPVGRLDRNSTGLLLLTNDGALTEQLTHPSYNKRKVYEVGLDRAIGPEDMQRLLDGVQLEDGLIRVDAIDYTLSLIHISEPTRRTQ